MPDASIDDVPADSIERDDPVVAPWLTAAVGSVVAGCAALLIVAWGIALLSPFMAGDAYAYFAHSRMAGRLDELYAADSVIQRVNNPLFFTIGRLLHWLAGGDGTALLRVLLAGLFVAGCGLCVALVGRRATPASRLALLVVLLVMPLSSYCQYFMPEVPYFFLVVVLAVVVVNAAEPLHGWTALAAGAILGLLLGTKPHAVAIAAALGMFVVFQHLRAAGGWGLLRAGRAVAMIVLGACAAYAGANASFHGLRPPAAADMFGRVYSPFVASGAAGRFSFATLLAMLGKHLAVNVALFGVPLILTARWVVEEAFRPSDPRDDERATHRAFRLAAWSLAVFAAALMLSVGFTTIVANKEPDQQMRIHGRYYSFALPLVLAAWVAAFPSISRRPWFPRWATAVAIGGAVVTIGCAAVGQRWFMLYPWDFPEALGLSRWPALGGMSNVLPWVVAAALTAAATAICLRPRWCLRAVGASLAVVFVAGQIAVGRWQLDNSRDLGRITREARTFAALLPQELRDRGLVVGENRFGRVAFALCGLAGNSRVITRPALSTIGPRAIPDHTAWMLVVDPIVVNVPAAVVIPGNETTFYRLLPPAPVGGGDDVVVEPANPADPTIFEGFNAREDWGRWSALPVSRLHLPKPVVGKLVVRFTGWAIHPETRRLEIEVGTGKGSVTLGDTPSVVHAVEIDAGSGGSLVTLRGVSPHRPNPWDRPLAVAVQRLEIGRAAGEAAGNPTASAGSE